MLKTISQFLVSFFMLTYSVEVDRRFVVGNKKIFKKLQRLAVGLMVGGVLGVSVANAAPYTISANGQEVMDAQTGLTWRRCAEGMTWDGSICTGRNNTYTHEQALQRAASEATSTGVAWRLPNVKELASIVDRTQFKPATDSSTFPATPVSWFWSSSPFVSAPSAALMVYFYDGAVNSNSREATLAVRLVR